MSTTNHNILYFLCNRGTFFANSGNRLWKAWMRQEWRGVGRLNLPEMLCELGSAAHLLVIDKRIPRRGRGQGAGLVQFMCGCVEKWTNEFNLT
jgi:hypothetical protein